MPQIIVTSDRSSSGDRAVTLIERVTVSDFESGHFQAQLVERLGWAVGDAKEAQRQLDAPSDADRQHAIAPAELPELVATRD